MKKMMALVVAVLMLTSFASMPMSAGAETTTAKEKPDGSATYCFLGSYGDDVEKNDTQISTSTFGYFNYTVLDDGTIEITGYNGEDGDVVILGGEVRIPSEIDGKKVTSIGELAFVYCDILTNITIPDSVTSIKNMAFAYCDRLKSITIPDSVTSIDSSALLSCYNLTDINVNGNNKHYSALNGILFNKKQTEIIIYPAGIKGEFTIPNNVTSIGNKAFMNCYKLTNITIPDSVTSIGYMAFSGCHNLSSINIPDSVTYIDNETFSNCNSLTSVNIPDGVTSIGVGAFLACRSLTSINIPDSVTSIGYNAFGYCNSLMDVYYLGTEEQWNNIQINDDNEPLASATIHFTIGIYGDVSGNGRITSVDALTILRSIAGYEHLSDKQQVLADVNCDGRITSVDALEVLRYYAGYTPTTKVSQAVYQ